MFRLYEESIPLSLEDIVGQSLTSLLVVGVVNPFGPTLTVVAVVGQFEAGRMLPVVYLMLNPFAQECTQVGETVISDTWQPLRDLQPLLDLPFGSCPSLVLASSYLEEEDSIALYAEFLRHFSNARRVFERVRKYPGDPWKRVQAEVQGAFGNLKKAIPGLSVECDEEPLSDDEAVEFASLLLSDQHLLPELQAFFFA
jgi:hypothetical protein